MGAVWPVLLGNSLVLHRGGEGVRKKNKQKGHKQRGVGGCLDVTRLIWHGMAFDRGFGWRDCFGFLPSFWIGINITN